MSLTILRSALSCSRETVQRNESSSGSRIRPSLVLISGKVRERTQCLREASLPLKSLVLAPVIDEKLFALELLFITRPSFQKK